MKKYAVIALGVLVATGCIERISDKPNTPPEGASETRELVVPASFDWKTTATVECEFTAAAAAVVSVALASDAEPFATFHVGGDAEPVTLDVPTSVRSLYVSYPRSGGGRATEAVEIANGKATFALPADAVPASRTRADIRNEVIHIPSGGWGTMMFEDLWPAYGDYDFNDFVLNYKIQLYPQNKNMVREMLIGLRVKAIGGTLPFVPRLRIAGVQGVKVSLVEYQYGGTNVPADQELVLLNPKDANNPAVLEFRGVNTKKYAPKGSAYLNTEPGCEVSDDDLVTVAYLVELRNPVWQHALTLEAFDFFLADAGGREIHLGGMKPTPEGWAIYERESKNANTAKAPGFYYSNDRMVWAINIPENVSHAYEKTDFLKAYPDFAKWVQSGGAEAKEWYKNGDKSNLVRAK